jgi:uncharacterized membrane protein YeaQ/YmgE (transglycosylase-associated protein family)
MDLVNLLVSLASGAVGGNAAGAIMKDKSLGGFGNSLAGILGGGLGSLILSQLGVIGSGGGTFDLAKIVGDIAGGGVGGGIVMAIIAAIRNVTSQKA